MLKRTFAVFVLIAVLGISFPMTSFADSVSLNQLAAPTASGGNGFTSAWSGDYLAVGHATSPYLSFYKREGDALTKLASPTAPTNQVLSVAWSGDYLAVAYFSSPYLSLYKREGDALTKLADPTSPAGVGRGVAWSGDYLAVAHSTTPFLSFYKREGDTLTKLTNPTAAAGQGNAVAWSGDYLAVAHNTTPFLSFYKREGDTLTKLTNPTALSGNGNAVSWSGDYLATAQATTPFISFYKREGDTLTKLADPTALASYGISVAWNGDYLAGVNFGTALYLYQRVGDTLTKLANPTALPGNGGGLSWSGNYMAAAHYTSPYLSLYKLVVTDTTDPTIQTLFPPNNDGAVPVNTNLIITFDEAVSVETGNISIYNASDDSLVEAIDVTSGQVTGDGTDTITINPTADLVGGPTDYYIQVDATAFDDLAGNSFAGILDENTWFFTTADETAPIISEVTPVSTPSTLTTPAYTFTTNEAGDITYGGSCASATTTAVSGSNTITFNALALGTYTDCTITVTDALNNDSNVLAVTSFSIVATPSSGGSSGSRRKAVLHTENPISPSPILTPPPVPSFMFLNNLFLGMTNPDVKELQKYLNTHGYPVAPSGPGSSGNETTKFGALTKAALIKFQIANHITPAVGFFGPITRGVVNSQN